MMVQWSILPYLVRNGAINGNTAFRMTQKFFEKNHSYRLKRLKEIIQVTLQDKPDYLIQSDLFR